MEVQEMPDAMLFGEFTLLLGGSFHQQFSRGLHGSLRKKCCSLVFRRFFPEKNKQRHVLWIYSRKITTYHDISLDFFEFVHVLGSKGIWFACRVATGLQCLPMFARLGLWPFPRASIVAKTNCLVQIIDASALSRRGMGKLKKSSRNISIA